jgi:NCAIR mutase (PurE)-related protein
MQVIAQAQRNSLATAQGKNQIGISHRMLKDSIKQLLEEVKTGEKSVYKALEALSFLPYEETEFARIDHHRHLRTGIPEAIFCEGKSPDQVKSIAGNILKHAGNLIATRLNSETFEILRELDERIVYHPLARMATLIQQPQAETKGSVLIITAGTADIPIAEEARITCTILGSSVNTLYDVGVAGIHRLFSEQEKISSARVLCVAAGMEGALASIVGGMTDKPIIAVPTSIGYGAHFHGLAALLTMINSCAPGIAVVNIDNGFGAGCMAHKINLIGEEKGGEE